MVALLVQPDALPFNPAGRLFLSRFKWPTAIVMVMVTVATAVATGADLAMTVMRVVAVASVTRVPVAATRTAPQTAVSAAVCFTPRRTRATASVGRLPPRATAATHAPV